MPNSPPTPGSSRSGVAAGVGLGTLGLIVLLFLADVLFAPDGRVLSGAGTDVWRQFAGWRAFGFGAWRSGDFPWWNPLVYGGMPFFSGFQSALLYPPNWLFLIGPLPLAIDGTIALHAFWLAAGVFGWVRRDGVHPAAAVFAGVVVVFGGPHFLHVFAGHLPNLCVMAWVPWLFLVVEAWRQEGRARWIAGGAVVVAMQILAGHPQYVYYSAVAAGFVALASATGSGASSRATFFLGFAAMFVGGACLAAVQLVPGLLAVAESVRAGGTGEMFAGSYSWPPESVLTSVVPGFFGDGVHRPYWGRWFYWETCAFVGVTGVLLVVLAAWRTSGRVRARRDLVVAAALVVLALGAYTPLFHVLLRVAPGYALFRGTSKFLFFAAVVAARPVAWGADAVLRGTPDVPGRRLGMAALATVLLASAGGALLATTAPRGGPAIWREWRSHLWATRQVTHLPRQQFFDAELSRVVALDAGRGLLVAAGLTAVAATLAIASRRRRAAGWALLALGSVDLVRFAASFRETFRLSDLILPEVVAYRTAHPGDFRVLDRTRANGGVLTGLADVWGDDPGVLRRYAEFVTATQGRSAGEAAQTLTIRGAHPRWDLLRFRAAFVTSAEGGVDVQEIDLHPLRRFEIVPRWEVLEGRDAILARVLAAEFDPRRTVVLESAPRGVDADAAAGEGHWTVLRESVDDVTVRVTAPRGGVLLMTDPFSRGWRAEAAGADAGRARYDVMPADWAFRAIPLPPGTHELRIFYRPPGLVAGALASSAAWAVLLGAVAFGARRHFPRRRSG